MMTDVTGASVPDQALVSDQAATRLDPAGFDPSRVIQHIASVAHAIGWQAGVGASETAGSIISFLARNPSHIPAFMQNGSVMDWPDRWHVEGCLSWHAKDGRVICPEDVRRRDSDRNPEGEDAQRLSAEHESAGRNGIAQPPVGESAQ